MLSFERLASLLAWSRTTSPTTPGVSLNSPGIKTESTTSGAEVSLLFGGGQRTPSALPRIAIDGIFDNGFTLGGSLGAMASSGKSGGESSLASLSGALFAVRAGYFAATRNVGFWLRGGFTYVSASGEVPASGGASSSTTATVTSWNLTLDPQLVLIAAPRVGITLGPLFDIPIGGTDTITRGAESVERDYRSSAFGVTAGATAIF